MGLFDFLQKRSGEMSPELADAALRAKVTALVLDRMREPNGRIRVEDVLSASATIVGERCIDAAGDFPLRDHEIIPGARVFSDKANELICGDVSGVPLSQMSRESIIGVLRMRIDTRFYPDSVFPFLTDVFKSYAASIGKPEDWGRVPLSVGEDHLPVLPPLQVGYETRAAVDAIFSTIREDRRRCLWIATESLAEILNMVASAIKHDLALLIAVETINGMAKTAPMTEKAFRERTKEG